MQGLRVGVQHLCSRLEEVHVKDGFGAPGGGGGGNNNKVGSDGKDPQREHPAGSTVILMPSEVNDEHLIQAMAACEQKAVRILEVLPGGPATEIHLDDLDLEGLHDRT